MCSRRSITSELLQKNWTSRGARLRSSKIARTLHLQVHDTTEAMEVANEQMREVAQKLAEIGADERENYRAERRKALIANLKRVFPDRVVRLWDWF